MNFDRSSLNYRCTPRILPDQLDAFIICIGLRSSYAPSSCSNDFELTYGCGRPVVEWKTRNRFSKIDFRFK